MFVLITNQLCNTHHSKVEKWCLTQDCQEVQIALLTHLCGQFRNGGGNGDVLENHLPSANQLIKSCSECQSGFRTYVVLRKRVLRSLHHLGSKITMEITV